MTIDTSALIAILLDEPEKVRFVEATMVVEGRKSSAGGRELDLFLHRARVTVVEVTSEQMEVARGAWRRFGKGRHPAGLNFGDCFSYALARVSGEPLLCKGDDFSRTDLRLVGMEGQVSAR